MDAEQLREAATKRYAAALNGYPAVQLDAKSRMLYDPRTLGARQQPAADSGAAAAKAKANALALANIKSFPKLLSVGEDDTLDAHHSYEIVQALAQHRGKMDDIEAELARLQKEDKSFNGYDSDQLADAFQKYAATHKELPQNFVAAGDKAKGNDADSTSSSSVKMNALAAGTGTGATGSGVVLASLTSGAAYSWSELLRSMDWARVLFTIVWIVTGLILLFFGYASLFWLNKFGVPSRRQHSVAAGLAEANRMGGEGKRSSRQSQAARRKKEKRALLGGGAGGVLIGFLFCSYLSAVINNALCVNEDKRKHLSAGAYFAVWLAPGLLGAVLAGHFAFLARAMAGVLGGTALTLILTAIFGIRTLLIRIVLVSILAAVFTAPLVQPRAKTVQMLLINTATSLIGMVTFLNGVALVAPSVEASSAWLELWTVLFMQDTASSREALIGGWKSSVFKGYIAGAVLGSVAGFLFELLLHRRCGHDPDAEWNQYLGAYTQHIEHGATSSPYDDPTAAAASAGMAARAALFASRAGNFEPAPSAWQRMVDFFDSDTSRPAHYGNLSGDGSGSPSRMVGEKMRRKRGGGGGGGANTGSGPARFAALSKRDHDDDDDDHSDSSDDDDEKHGADFDDEATELGSDDGKKGVKGGEALTKSPPTSTATLNYGGYALPRPPMITMSSSASGGSSSSTRPSDSRLSGSTARESNAEAGVGSRTGDRSDVHKPINVYRDSLTPAPKPRSAPPPAAASASAPPASASVPATPSLINAITRIELAQRQARTWQQQHDTHAAPYPSSPPPPSSASAKKP